MVLFEDGFESNNFTKWTSTQGGPTTVGVPVHSGNFAAQAISDGVSSIFWDKDLPLAYSTLYAAGWVYFPALLANGESMNFMLIGSAGGDWVAAGYAVDPGGVSALRLSSSGGGSSEFLFSVAPQTWYFVEIKYVKGVGTAESALWLNGSPVATISGDTLNQDAVALLAGIPQNAPNLFTVIGDDYSMNDSYIPMQAPPFFTLVKGRG